MVNHAFWPGSTLRRWLAIVCLWFSKLLTMVKIHNNLLLVNHAFGLTLTIFFPVKTMSCHCCAMLFKRLLSNYCHNMFNLMTIIYDIYIWYMIYIYDIYIYTNNIMIMIVYSSRIHHHFIIKNAWSFHDWLVKFYNLLNMFWPWSTIVSTHSELLGQFRESDLGCNTQYSMMT